MNVRTFCLAKKKKKNILHNARNSFAILMLLTVFFTKISKLYVLTINNR